MENQEAEINISELVWRLSYQVTASPTANRSNISEDGSCFIIHYQDRDILITADHILHALDFAEGLRGNEERYISIVTNISNKEKCQTILATLGGFISYTQFNDPTSFKDYIDTEDIKTIIPDDMPDITFAKFTNPQHLTFITHELRDDQQQILVPAGILKDIIKEDMFGEISNNIDSRYIVGGVVHNVEQNGVWNRCNALYTDLRYKETLPDGMVILSYPGNVIYKNWAALSGSPVFNCNGTFVGMLLRVSEEDNHVVIMPLHLILKYINMAIRTKQI